MPDNMFPSVLSLVVVRFKCLRFADIVTTVDSYYTVLKFFKGTQWPGTLDLLNS